MENDTQQSNLDANTTASSKVLEKIRHKQVAMKPRLYFTLKSIALIVVAVLTLLISVAIGCFILFSIRTSYETSLLGFGPHGVLIFLQLFPWGLLIADIALIILLEWMLRRFRFGYKSPLLYLLFAIIVLTISVTVVLDQSHASDEFLQGAHEHGVPLMGNLYDQGRRPPPPGSGACPCVVTAIDGAILTMQEQVPDGTTRDVTVILPNDQASSTIQVGDHLFIIGNFQNGILHAVDVHYMDGDNDADDGNPPLQTFNK
jgi:hypothetical protein